MGTRVGSKIILPQNPLLSESLLSLSLQDKLPEEPKRLVLSLDEGLYGCGLLTRLTQHTDEVCALCEIQVFKDSLDRA
jgi:hypothetical protein